MGAGKIMTWPVICSKTRNILVGFPCFTYSYLKGSMGRSAIIKIVPPAPISVTKVSGPILRL